MNGEYQQSLTDREQAWLRGQTPTGVVLRSDIDALVASGIPHAVQLPVQYTQQPLLPPPITVPPPNHAPAPTPNNNPTPNNYYIPFEPLDPFDKDPTLIPTDRSERNFSITDYRALSESDRQQYARNLDYIIGQERHDYAYSVAQLEGRKTLNDIEYGYGAAVRFKSEIQRFGWEEQGYNISNEQMFEWSLDEARQLAEAIVTQSQLASGLYTEATDGSIQPKSGRLASLQNGIANTQWVTNLVANVMIDAGAETLTYSMSSLFRGISTAVGLSVLAGFKFSQRRASKVLSNYDDYNRHALRLEQQLNELVQNLENHPHKDAFYATDYPVSELLRVTYYRTEHARRSERNAKITNAVSTAAFAGVFDLMVSVA